MQTKYVLNNKVTEQEFERIVYQWLSEGDYTPDDIIENIITENNQVLVPMYYLKGEYSGYCSVSLGYQRQEYYYSWDNVNKKQVRHSRTVTDWHPHSQNIQGTAVTISYAGTPIDEEIAGFVESMPWKGEDLQEVPMNSDHFQQVCELFKFNSTESWNNKGSKKVYNEAVKQTILKLPSSLYQQLNLDVKFEERVSFGVAAPYWLFTYEYNEQSYYVIVDGHSPNRLIGRKPEDKKRKTTVRMLYFFGWLIGLSGTLVALYIFNDQSFSDISLTWKNVGISVIGIIITAILVSYEVIKIKSKSKKERQNKLTEKMSK